MSTVVLIAMHEDDARMRKIVEALLHEKLDLWWERPEAGVGGWERSVKTVMEARSVVFFWSAASLSDKGESYRDLVRRALAADKAVFARLERVKVPDEFKGGTHIDLSGWRRGAKDVFLLDLAHTATAKAAGLDPPPLRGPARVMFRRAAITLPTILFGIGLFGTFKGLYGDFGLDNLASRTERRDWAAVHPGSCADLRTFLSVHPGGPNSDRAKTLLAARREWSDPSWQPVQKPLPLYVTRGAAEARPGEAAARTLAQTRAAKQSAKECQAYAEAGSFRYVSATVQVGQWQCEPLASGVVCGIEGTSQCSLQQEADTVREQCGPTGPVKTAAGSVKKPG
jgi:hypothetical protein